MFPSKRHVSHLMLNKTALWDKHLTLKRTINERARLTYVHCRNNGLTCTVPKKNIFENCEWNGKKSGMTNVRQTGQTTKRTRLTFAPTWWSYMHMCLKNIVRKMRTKRQKKRHDSVTYDKRARLQRNGKRTRLKCSNNELSSWKREKRRLKKH